MNNQISYEADKSSCETGGYDIKNPDMNESEILQERYELAYGRIREIACPDGETDNMPAFALYFRTVAGFLARLGEEKEWLASEYPARAGLEEWKKRNRELYADILPDAYENSYANPAAACLKLGDTFGSLLSCLYYELRSIIGFVYEGKLQEIVIRMELFAEVYTAFVCEWQERQALPEYETIRQILYWFVFDYADSSARERVGQLVMPEHNFAAGIIEQADLADPIYLFAYGEYVSDNEIATAAFLAQLPEETISLMADTYTEGYRIGFELYNKDLTKKGTVDIRYRLGFERMIKKAVANFAVMGLKPVIYRAPASILNGSSLVKNGFYGANPNRQYDYDHKDDMGLFLDKALKNRRLEVYRTAFSEYRENALLYAGPAVVETFGEADFEPENKPGCIRLTKEQQELWVELRSRMGELQREFILEEERSFTIIAFPVPEIGEHFPEIFQDIIRINTLDYDKYRRIQQIIIDALDRADYCQIRGKCGNRTDLTVNLHKLKNPEKETIFENCVADVNIPVGEVFTSPVLKGTNGVLHVKKVFLNGLEYKDLTLTFQDGMVTEYSCHNFDRQEDNLAFVRENIMFRHESLPLGEFAIGTNTTAYMAAKKYGIERKLPILIAEKMGPHFAVGDTCYSHEEDIAVFNPDGKEIVARDNERSLLRGTEPERAYFNCHTDITIPYDELGELTAVSVDGTRIPILQDGRFVLPGSEELNKPMEDNSSAAVTTL